MMIEEISCFPLPSQKMIFSYSCGLHFHFIYWQ